MKDKLIIIGASGHGKVIVDIAIKMNKWQSIAFLDDEFVNTAMDIPIIGKTNEAITYKDEADFFVAIGNNVIREMIQERLIEQGLNVVRLIHPSAVISRDVEIGIGTVIMAGVIINVSTRIGKGCIINTSSSLDHDNNIGNYVHISPGVRVAGTVRVCNGTWLGVGSVISNNVHICRDCTIGAGAVVLKNITKPGKYVGIPAKRAVR